MLEKLNRHAKGLGASLPLLRNVVLRVKYREEISLINACRASSSDHRSNLHFSVNKSATQYVKHILRSCAKEHAMIHIDFGGYAFHSNFPYLDQLSPEQMRSFQHLFRASGYVYSPFGGMVADIPQIADYHIVLVLRDPRDVLTSEFFSIGRSHRMPPAASNKSGAFRELRSRARVLTIDEYVICESARVKAAYQRYIDSLLEPGHPVAVLKYEDMILDFPRWLTKLEAHCELSMSSELRERLMNDARRAGSRKEQVDSHARQLRPGDHRRKLREQTIAELNERFTDILSRLDYELS